MCIIEDDDFSANDDGTVSVWCYCGWQATRPTKEAADEAGRAHIDAFDESERVYAESPAAWVERYGLTAPAPTPTR
jgi:hypothetical protein